MVIFLFGSRRIFAFGALQSIILALAEGISR
jgi:hypothetical protein